MQEEEMLDLVNEHDQIIGEVSKTKANQDPGLIHREVAVIICDEHKNILFQKRSINKTVAPGMWTISCAGHVTKGLMPEDAAHKELKEELGFDTKLVFVEKVFVKKETEARFIYCYIGKYDGERISLETDEVEQYTFMDSNELTKLLESNTPISERSVEYAKRFWSGEFNQLLEQL